MLCAHIDASGNIRPLDPQPARVFDCALVIQSGTEVTSNPFLMTRTEAYGLGISIAVLWVTVGAIKHFSRRFF